MIFSIITLSKATLSIMTLGMATLSKEILSITTPRIKTLCTIVLRLLVRHDQIMLSVAI
jgi:hypothetical protein